MINSCCVLKWASRIMHQVSVCVCVFFFTSTIFQLTNSLPSFVALTTLCMQSNKSDWHNRQSIWMIAIPPLSRYVLRRRSIWNRHHTERSQQMRHVWRPFLAYGVWVMCDKCSIRYCNYYGKTMLKSQVDKIYLINIMRFVLFVHHILPARTHTTIRLRCGMCDFMLYFIYFVRVCFIICIL